MKKNTDFIYLLRFVAAIIVVLNHYSPIRNTFVNNGDDAVSFFFLLSGFILVVAYEKDIIQNNFSTRLFYVKRIARVYPLFLFALFLTLGYHFLIHHEHTHLPEKLPFELFMVQTWFYPGSINYPAWSISCEFFFYLLFPIYIVKLQNKRLRSVIAAVFIIITAIATSSYLLESQSYNFLKPDLKGGYLYQHPLVRLPAFFVGNILGLMFIKNFKLSTLQLTALFFTGCFFVILWTFKPINLGLSLKQVGLLFIYSTLIIVLLQNESFSMKYLSNKQFINLGDISYGIYLLQFPVSSFVLLFTNDLHTSVHFFIFLTVLILMSFITYQYIEKPLRLHIVNLYKTVVSKNDYGYNIASESRNTEGGK